MKKIIILILAVVSFSMVICGNFGGETLSWSEGLQRLSDEPERLAEFLFATNELDDFMVIDPEDYPKNIENAVAIFAKDEQTHQKALKRAEEVLSEIANQ